MMSWWKKYGTGCLCLLVLVSGLIIHLAMPDKALSESERRRLDQVPSLTVETVLNTEFMADVESYLQDQFPARETFRKMKAIIWYNVLQMKDNHQVYFVDGYAGKLHYPLRESAVTLFADKIESLKTKYFPQSNVYLAVIPEKNYYLAEPNGYPDLDYERMFELLDENLTGVAISDLSGLLEPSDYYRTDIHWKQECVTDVAAYLLDWMGIETIPDYGAMEQHTINEFYGSYYGQAALPMPADEIVYLRNEEIDNAVVQHQETGRKTGVYDLDKLTDEKSVDKYDIYLSGADALSVITNPAVKNGKHLIVFRDSFASSLVPLMVPAYEKITMIDLRYVSSAILGQYVDFKGKGTNRPDVLFIYNTQLINQSTILK